MDDQFIRLFSSILRISHTGESVITLNNLRNIMRKQPELLNSVSPDGDTPLHFLIRNSQPFELINELLLFGADVNFPGPSSSTPLHYAVKFLSEDVMLKVVQLLIKYGANVNLRDENDHSPLHVLLEIASGNKHLEVIKFLLKNGINTDHMSEDFPSYLFHSLFHVSKVNLKLKISKVLLKFGAKPERSLISEIDDLDFPNFKRGSVELAKLLMQYILIDEFQTIYNDGKLICSWNYKHPSFCLPPHCKLTRYQKTLMKELTLLCEDKIDEKETLFSFLSVHCSSGDTFMSNLPILCKVISQFKQNRYKCCKDLFRASMKRNALLKILLNLRISTKEHLSESLRQNSCVLPIGANSRISAYLSQNDLINLILASLDQTKQPRCIRIRICSLKRKNIFSGGFGELLKKRIKLDI